MKDINSIKEKLVSFLEKTLRQDFDEDEDIFTIAKTNSLFAFQLVLFLESEFDFEITDKNMNEASFKSINTISRMVIYNNGDDNES